jgi:hypothetical protein
MAPPGIPQFETRDRIAERGHHLLEGRAWSGRAPIARVDVSVDDGRTWSDATLLREFDEDYAWCGWSFSWDATPGDHVLCSRATDETGDVQPLEVVWNLGGYENNAVQRVRVHVD